MNIDALRSKAHSLKPIVTLGKNGVSEGQLEEIKRQLKQKKLIKIKILKSVADSKDELIAEILELTGAVLVQKLGHVVVLHKK